MTSRAWALLGVMLALLLLSPFAHAVGTTVSPTGGMFLNYVRGGVKMSDGGAFDAFMGRVYTARTAGGGASVAERYGFQLGGNAVRVTATRAIPLSAVAGAIAAAGAAGYAGFQTGAAISHWLGNDTLTIGPMRCTASYGGWKCDGGQVPALGTPTTCLGYPKSLVGSPNGTPGCVTLQQVCAYRYRYYPPSTFGRVSTTPGFEDPEGCEYLFPNASCSATGGVCRAAGEHMGAPTNQPDQTQSGCPATIDALDPRWSRPSGSPPDADGKCPTGQYNTATVGDVSERLQTPSLAPSLEAHRDELPAVLEKLSEDGEPIEGASPRELTLDSPPHVVGDPQTTTTTGPDGVPHTTTETPTEDVTCTGDECDYVDGSTTTNPDGSTTDQTNNPPPPDPCEANPNRVGCVELGDPGNDKPTWTEKPITFAIEDLGFGGSCPAPWNGTVHGWHLSMSYGPACDNAPAIRLALIALSALGAMFTLMKLTQ